VSSFAPATVAAPSRKAANNLFMRGF
jgi:hypothetical protein